MKASADKTTHHNCKGYEIDLAHALVCIVGPTASGKSELAQDIALALDGEVISADSMQIYQGMDIGTAKIPPDKQKVKHWGLDLIRPDESYSASLFQNYARTCIADIDSRGKRAILAGGTGFYIRAVIDDYRFPPGEQVQNSTRVHYLKMANEQGAEEVWRVLQEKDPASAALIPSADLKRVIRALELLEDNYSYAAQKKALASISQIMPAYMIGLEVNPEVLNKRIDDRVEAMFENGLLQELERLLEAGFKESLTAGAAIGYKELIAYVDGNCSLEDAKKRIKTATHRYAKRQRTWFRKDKRINWISADAASVSDMRERSLRLIATMEQTSR